MKKLLIFVVFAAVLASLILFVLPRFPRQERVARPAPPASPWNSGAIQGTFAGVEVREADPTHATLLFSYDLDNNTSLDYRFTKGPGTVVMTRLKSDGSLSSAEPIELDNSAFLPARNRTRIAVQITRPFNWPAGMAPGQIGPVNQEKFRQFVSEEVANLSGFALFDQATHFQVELPGGWQELQMSASAAGLN
ncbi:MAG: hypothetical protein WA192_09965 [Candidatus Acidiferrales bacterium]